MGDVSRKISVLALTDIGVMFANMVRWDLLLDVFFKTSILLKKIQRDIENIQSKVESITFEPNFLLQCIVFDRV